MAGVELGAGPVGLRLDGRGWTAGSGNLEDGTLRAASLGVAITYRLNSAGRWRPYLLGSLGYGLDFREADHAVLIGAGLGLESRSRPALFGELRYDRWEQSGSRHVTFAGGTGSLLFGLRLF